jgi:hypothetical protein
VTHTCNPGYSGGREQEDRGSKPAPENSSTIPYLKNPFTKIGLVEWLKVKALSSSPSTAKKTNPQYCKKNKKRQFYSQAWWHLTRILVLRKPRRIRDLRPAPGKNMRPYLKNNLKQKKNQRHGASGHM